MGNGSSKRQRDNQSKIVPNNSKESSFPDVYEDSQAQFREIPDNSRVLDNESEWPARSPQPQSFAEDPISITLGGASPISRPQCVRIYPKNACKVLDFRTFPIHRQNSESKLIKTSDYVRPIPLERRWTGFTNSRPTPKTWMDELKEGINDLAVTRAPTTIDPPDLLFLPSRSEELIHTLVEKNDRSVTTDESETEDEAMIDEILENSAQNREVMPVNSQTPSSNSDCEENTQQYQQDDAGDSDCSSSPKFWAKQPRARASGSRIASFMVPPLESTPTTTTRATTPIIKRNTEKSAGSVRNSFSAQDWKSPRGKLNLNRNKTSVSSTSFYPTNPELSKATHSDQYKQPPSEPLNYISENEETDTAEVSDQSCPPSAQVDTDDDEKYFTYKKSPRLNKDKSPSSSSSRSIPENEGSLNKLGYEELTKFSNRFRLRLGLMNLATEYKYCHFEGDRLKEERVTSADMYSFEGEPEFDNWSNGSDYGIDQITPPSELAELGTYSEDESSNFTSSGDEGKLNKVAQIANMDAPKLQKSETEIESSRGSSVQSDPTTTTTIDEPRKRKRKAAGLLCRRFFRFFKKHTETDNN